MILLDTNVVSEAMKPQPNVAVTQWLDEQVAQTLYISTVTMAELMFGISALPKGNRQAKLSATLDGLLGYFEGRILSFDQNAARRYALLAVKARVAGLGFTTPDGYIAAIAACNNFHVASRDASAFEAAGLNVIDPWSYLSLTR
jgi:toxin FitB